MPGDFQSALSRLDEAHALDPNTTTVSGKEIPYELHYSHKMSAYLEKRDPNASDALKLAIRAQHFRRWEVPRSSYPMTRAGYYSWRTFLKKRQAEQASAICAKCGYNAAECERIAAMIRKEDLKVDEETQVLEDVACLVFLDDQFEDFEKNHDEDKIIGILRKTWVKMTPAGQQMAKDMKMGGAPRNC